MHAESASTWWIGGFSIDVKKNVDCNAVPFSLPTSELRAGGDWCEMRGRAGLEKREGRVLRGRASRTSRLPRVVRWLGEKKGTALQSQKNVAFRWKDRQIYRQTYTIHQRVAHNNNTHY